MGVLRWAVWGGWVPLLHRVFGAQGSFPLTSLPLERVAQGPGWDGHCVCVQAAGWREMGLFCCQGYPLHFLIKWQLPLIKSTK